MSYKPICAKCPFELKDRKCYSTDGKGAGGCPTKHFEEDRDSVLKAYESKELDRFYRLSSDMKGKPRTRIDETLHLAKQMNYKKIGLAFCTGLRREAAIVSGLFEKNGFEVASVICKCGNIRKHEVDDSALGKDGDKLFCNPYLQAKALNEAKTEWNIVLGLCVGHDSIFMKYSDAMCTVLAAKDRVAAHNPLGPVYTLDSYYSFLKK